jgi:hypothetical protein
MIRRNAKLVCVAGHRRDEYTAEPAGGHQEIYEPRNTRLEVYLAFFYVLAYTRAYYLNPHGSVYIGVAWSGSRCLNFTFQFCKKSKKFVLLFFIYFLPREKKH